MQRSLSNNTLLVDRFRLGGPDGDAEEIMQNAFVRTLLRRQSNT